MKVNVYSPNQPHVIISEGLTDGRFVLVMANSGWESDGFYEFVSESVRDGMEPETWWVRADRIAKDKQLHVSFAQLVMREDWVDCMLMGSIRLIDDSSGIEALGHFDERCKRAITRALGIGTGDPKVSRIGYTKNLKIRFGFGSGDEMVGTVVELPEPQ